MTFSFLAATAMLLIVPGPTNALLFAAAAVGGIWRGLRAALAATAGYLVAVSVIGGAIGPMLTQSPALLNGVRLVAAGYLCLSACRLWHAEAGRANEATISGLAVFLTTLLNPKALIIALALMPEGSFDNLAAALPRLGALGLLVLAISSLWAGFGATMRHGLRAASPRLTTRASAVALGIFGMGLLVSGLTG